MDKVAHFVKDVSENFNGIAHVYRMEPPHEDHEYVVASGVDFSTVPGLSAVSTFFMHDPIQGAETYIFPWDFEADTIKDWGELDGSQKGIVSPQIVIEELGYTVIKEDQWSRTS